MEEIYFIQAMNHNFRSRSDRKPGRGKFVTLSSTLTQTNHINQKINWRCLECDKVESSFHLLECIIWHQQWHALECEHFSFRLCLRHKHHIKFNVVVNFETFIVKFRSFVHHFLLEGKRLKHVTRRSFVKHTQFFINSIKSSSNFLCRFSTDINFVAIFKAFKLLINFLA